jgi:hypothetical protein
VVYAIHGVVEDRNAERIAHNNFVDESKFRSFLAQRSSFVDLGEALRTDGAALTIDDRPWPLDALPRLPSSTVTRSLCL